ncbi:uncharacterized protein B0T15DRAFT_154600 [Chaetomium strumarium]|uniref:Uncharacterized protein n=1 Tax=Chaetomium strumarium TaxID=1170767 RepID=A0AAJ0GVD2_9PEZI|nr:hypothetical protein B0T15DRAFT_154600 [Chaetomium strumarium]
MDAEREQLLPVGYHARPRHGSQSGALIPNELFEGNANPDEADTDSRNRAAHLEACRRSLEFQMEQYLKYVVRVRSTGMEPKGLLAGLEVPESGPNAPTLDFWCLIAVRDRFIARSNILLEELRAKKTRARKSLARSLRSSGLVASISVIATSVAAEPAIRPMLYAACFLPLLYNAPLVGKVWVTERCEGKLKALVQRAIVWDLDGGDRDELQSFSRLFRMLL